MVVAYTNAGVSNVKSVPLGLCDCHIRPHVISVPRRPERKLSGDDAGGEVGEHSLAQTIRGLVRNTRLGIESLDSAVVPTSDPLWPDHLALETALRGIKSVWIYLTGLGDCLDIKSPPN
jgi:hypothetical protein